MVCLRRAYPTSDHRTAQCIRRQYGRDIAGDRQPNQSAVADKAHDADSLRRWLKKAKIKAVIPSSAARHTRSTKKTYRRRNVIERLFCGSRIDAASQHTTRERLASNYLSAIVLVASLIS